MEDKFLHLTALEMETMRVLVIHGKTYGLSVMHKLNEGRDKYKLPEVGYGTFYPVLKKLEREKLIKSVPQSENKKRKDYELTGLGTRTYEANLNYQEWLFAKDIKVQTI